MRLRDESGAVLAENDDADGTNSRVDVPEALAAGRYCLEMENLNGDASAVRATLAPFDAAADRLRRIDAAEFSPLADVDVRELGELGASAVVDVAASGSASWLRFDVPEEGVVAIEAVGQGIDPAVMLFDRIGRRVEENDDGPDGLDSLLVQRVRAGSYLMAVRLASGGGDAGTTCGCCSSATCRRSRAEGWGAREGAPRAAATPAYRESSEAAPSASGDGAF